MMAAKMNMKILTLADYVNDGDDEIADYKLRDDNYPEIMKNKKQFRYA